ncbi:unnamed protein product [Mytilus edulis]|uniref:G-protein coupled receptors family 1 profile domain-containing protein n=1 Tax=Mytilus edulis TaxID=6550 RepID=A0A8S3U664_MYTED|nr:unnamed protein product [Mytilus edulis]
MKKHLNHLISVPTLSETQIKQRRKAILKMRKNVITLSIIIVFTICGILPRTIYGLYSQSIKEPSLDVINLTNTLLLLNPLFDPFVYVFRIQEFRSRLKFKCFKSNKIGNFATVTANQTNTKTSNKIGNFATVTANLTNTKTSNKIGNYATVTANQTHTKTQVLDNDGNM